MSLQRIKYLLLKVRRRIFEIRKRLWKYCNIERESMRGYKPFKDHYAFKKQLQYMLGVYNSKLLDGINDDERKMILSTAEQALSHEFDLLGSGVTKLEPINWQIDFKSGYKWEKKFYCEIEKSKGADIKVPWELSRCQHLLWLGEAYLLTEDERYAKEVVAEINWWIADNPLMYSVNWTCAMDVSFRAINWMFALNMISEFEGFDNEFSSKVSRSLWQHGFFVRNNLEKSIPYSNNHYCSDLVGLLYVGNLFNYRRKGRQWLRYGFKEYIKEIRTQVFFSGVHYERSISYHRMMTEMLSYPVYMLKRTGVEMPSDIVERIGRMYGYINDYTKPNGKAPLIADNDDGRFVPLLKRDFREHNYLNYRDSIENRFIALGEINRFCANSTQTQDYKDAGVAIVRNGKYYLYINHGGYSKKPAESDSIINTHTHNDLLSFELCIGGKDVIVDAGTYLYTSSETERNSFRSGTKHNTVVVDNEEINGFAGSFSLKRNVHQSRLNQLDDGIYEGSYYTIKCGLNHRRRFTVAEDSIEITDYLNKDGNNHFAQLFFHLAEGITAELKDNEVVISDDIKLSFSQPPFSIDIIDDKISPSYGVLVDSKTIRTVFVFNDEVVIKTKIIR